MAPSFWCYGPALLHKTFNKNTLNEIKIVAQRNKKKIIISNPISESDRVFIRRRVKENQLQTAPKNRHRSLFDLVVIHFTEDELKYSIIMTIHNINKVTCQIFDYLPDFSSPILLQRHDMKPNMDFKTVMQPSVRLSKPQIAPPFEGRTNGMRNKWLIEYYLT